MRQMPGWWLKERATSKARKASRRRVTDSLVRGEDIWVAKPYEPEPEGPPVPFMPCPDPRSFYQFCVERTRAYESRGEPIAAMVYWALRSLDMGSPGPYVIPGEDPPTDEEFDPDNPCSDKGWVELCGYWDYKIDWLIHSKGLLTT